MCGIPFNYYANIGKIHLSDYVRDRQGLKAGMFGRAYNALADKLTSQANLTARERLRAILDIAYETKTGRPLIEAGAEGGASVVFEPSFAAGEGSLDSFGSIVRVSPKDPDDYLANIIVHELQHSQQEVAITAAFGSRRHFYDTAKGLADTAYPVLIGEAQAFTVQAVNAYEMHLAGRPGPWALHRFARRYSHHTAALEAQMEKGADPHAPETQQAVFTAWMENSPARAAYDARFMQDLAYGAFFLPMDPVRGMTHANADLVRITQDAGGNSPFTGLDLQKPSFTGPWAMLDPAEDITRVAEYMSATAYVFERYAQAAEILDLAADHFSGHGRWKDLPDGYGAQTLVVDEKAAGFGARIGELLGDKDTPGNVRAATILLLERARDLGDRYAEAKPLLVPAVEKWADALKGRPGPAPSSKPPAFR